MWVFFVLAFAVGWATWLFALWLEDRLLRKCEDCGEPTKNLYSYTGAIVCFECFKIRFLKELG